MGAAEIFLVDGPPGTGIRGKTTYLSRQAVRAVDKHGPAALVIASLTRTAATEIADAAAKAAHAAGHVIPDGAVGTIHAHAYRGLDRPELAETPEGIRAWNEAHPANQMTGGAPSKLEDAPAVETDEDGGSGRTRADELHAAVTNHRARRTDPALWTPEEIAHAAAWWDFKTQTGRLDFTDLIERATEHGVHFMHPKVLLLDEAQDFSRLELRLAMRWAQHTETTVVVGDTRQALYQWRGSDPETLEHLQVTERRILNQSYRVPRAVHELAQRWVGQLPSGAAAYKPTGHDGVARHLPLSLRNPGALIDAIEADLADGMSVMVLTTCGYMLAPVLAELRDRGLPFHNPYRVKQGAWNPMRAAGRLLAFLRPDERVWGDQARAWTWNDLRLWVEPLKARGVLERGAKAHIEDKCRPDRFRETPMADQEVPIETLVELFGASAGDIGLLHPIFRSDVDWWAANLLASQSKAMRYPLQVLKRQGHQALAAAPRAVVGTIHSVKGGEADSVYLFPDLSKQGMWHGWHHGGAPRDQIIRMIYVGITRARRQITICDPSDADHVPLDLLVDRPASANAPVAGALEQRLQERFGRAA